MARVRTWVIVPVLILGAGTILSSCGSASSAPSRASIVTSACSKVNADLSDGPDPGADPIGYAEAQILPLSKIKVADQPLQKDIRSLDDAYTEYFVLKGKQKTPDTVKHSLNRLATFCPGVGS